MIYDCRFIKNIRGMSDVTSQGMDRGDYIGIYLRHHCKFYRRLSQNFASIVGHDFNRGRGLLIILNNLFQNFKPRSCKTGHNLRVCVGCGTPYSFTNITKHCITRTSTSSVGPIFRWSTSWHIYQQLVCIGKPRKYAETQSTVQHAKRLLSVRAVWLRTRARANPNPPGGNYAGVATYMWQHIASKDRLPASWKMSDCVHLPLDAMTPAGRVRDRMSDSPSSVSWLLQFLLI